MDGVGELSWKQQMKCREMERLMGVIVTGEKWVEKRRVDGKIEEII